MLESVILGRFNHTGSKPHSDLKLASSHLFPYVLLLTLIRRDFLVKFVKNIFSHAEFTEVVENG